MLIIPKMSQNLIQIFLFAILFARVASACDPTCLTCSGDQPTNCTSCDPKGHIPFLVPSNNSCVACNVDGYFQDYFSSSTDRCIACDPTCKTCFGPLNDNCLSCSEGLFVYDGSCVTCDQDGYFPNGPSCFLCDITCKTCNGSSATDCLSCYSNGSFQASNGTCTYNDASCDPICKTCFYGPSWENCFSCFTGEFLMTFEASDQYPFFVSYCGDCALNNGSFTDGTNCFFCQWPCYNCSGPATNCLSCHYGYYFNGTNCLACKSPCDSCNGSSATDCTSCQIGYYLNGSTCTACDSSCLDCNGPSATDCSYCVYGYYLPAPNSTCSHCDLGCLTCNGSSATDCSDCMFGYYYLFANSTCAACDPNCAACFGNSTTCLSCNDGFYLNSSDFSCSACNIDGYVQYYDECLPCNPSCKTCYGIRDIDCLSCNSGGSLQASNNTCTYTCDSSCNTCYGTSATNCLSCKNGTYWLYSNSSCVDCNVDGYFQNNYSSSYCGACDSNCKSCNDDSAADCLSCHDGFYLLASNSTCNACDSSCKTCNGNAPTNCLSCNSVTYLSNSNNSCVPCNVTSYFIDSSFKCNVCDPMCQTCNGLLATNCLSCYDRNYLSVSNNSCVKAIRVVSANVAYDMSVDVFYEWNGPAVFIESVAIVLSIPSDRVRIIAIISLSGRSRRLLTDDRMLDNSSQTMVQSEITVANSGSGESSTSDDTDPNSIIDSLNEAIKKGELSIGGVNPSSISYEIITNGYSASTSPNYSLIVGLSVGLPLGIIVIVVIAYNLQKRARKCRRKRGVTINNSTKRNTNIEAPHLFQEGPKEEGPKEEGEKGDSPVPSRI